MDELLFKNEFEFTEDMFLEFQDTFYKKKHIKRFYFKRIVLFFFAINAVVFMYLQNLALSITFAVLTLAMFYLTFIFLKKANKMMYKAFVDSNGSKLERKFYKNYYELVNSKGTTKCKYSNLSDFYSTSNLYILGDGDDNILLVKNSFTKGTDAEFVKHIESLIKDKN